jgi:hypothetical protein
MFHGSAFMRSYERECFVSTLTPTVAVPYPEAIVWISRRSANAKQLTRTKGIRVGIAIFQGIRSRMLALCPGPRSQSLTGAQMTWFVIPQQVLCFADTPECSLLILLTKSWFVRRLIEWQSWVDPERDSEWMCTTWQSTRISVIDITNEIVICQALGRGLNDNPERGRTLRDKAPSFPK